MTAPLAAAIAFAVFILLLWYLGAHRRLLALLDDRTRAVKHELTEAETMLAEARALLAELEERKASAEREAQKIVETGHERAEEMARQAAIQMEEFVRRRTEQAERKIVLAQQDLRKHIQISVMDVAVRAAEHLLLGETGQAKAVGLIDSSIKQVGAAFK
jgi:F-type H+-transporting ATPase subunit b